MTLDDLDKRIREDGVLAVNIQYGGGQFRVHVRQSSSFGFTCAQKGHASLGAALIEHFKSQTDLSDLLV